MHNGQDLHTIFFDGQAFGYYESSGITTLFHFSVFQNIWNCGPHHQLIISDNYQNNINFF